MSIERMRLQPPPNWQVRFTGCDHMVFAAFFARDPCWFHRQMLRLVFGVVFERVVDTSEAGTPEEWRDALDGKLREGDWLRRAMKR